MYYRIKFRAGVNEYIFKGGNDIHTVRDIKQIIKQTFGFQTCDIAVFNSGQRLKENDLFDHESTYIVRQINRNYR